MGSGCGYNEEMKNLYWHAHQNLLMVKIFQWHYRCPGRTCTLGNTLVVLLKLALTIPVSTAKCECSFSTLKRTNIYLHSSMSEARLNNMAIMSIERDIADNLDFEEVVQKFAKDTCNRRILLD